MLHWCNRLFWLMCALVRDIVTKSLRQLLVVVCENLCVPLSTRNRDIRHAAIEQVFRRKRRIYMDKNAVGCLSLTGIAGDGVAVVEMRMTLRFVVHTAPVIKLQPHRAVRRDVFHCTQFTVRNLQLMIGRSELDTVSNRKCLLLLAIVSRDEHPVQTLVPRQEMTGADRSWAQQYQVNAELQSRGIDILRYSRSSRETGIAKGDYTRVKSIDAQNNRLTVLRVDGSETTYDPRRQMGVSVAWMR